MKEQWEEEKNDLKRYLKEREEEIEDLKLQNKAMKEINKNLFEKENEQV